MWQVGVETNLYKENINPYLVKSNLKASLSSRFVYAGVTLLSTAMLTNKNKLTWAILNSGASSQFLLSDAP